MEISSKFGHPSYLQSAWMVQPGTTMVVTGEKGAPLAFGVTLSGDEKARAATLNQFSNDLRAVNPGFADQALDLVKHLYPDWDLSITATAAGFVLVGDVLNINKALDRDNPAA